MTNLTWHHGAVSREKRQKQNNHRSVILWFTGLSGSGKSTLAHAVEEYLHKSGCRTFVLDGDNVRHGLCSDLGFSNQDRTENIRRVGEVAKLFIEAGTIVLTAFISPFRHDRDLVKKLGQDKDFIEIYCQCPLDICESRDVKGLYQRARLGEIHDFTGISSPYEPPLHPDLVLDTANTTIDDGLRKVIALLRKRGVINDDQAREEIRA